MSAGGDGGGSGICARLLRLLCLRGAFRGAFHGAFRLRKFSALNRSAGTCLPLIYSGIPTTVWSAEY